MRDQLPDLRAIVLYGEEEAGVEGILSWAELLR